MVKRADDRAWSLVSPPHPLPLEICEPKTVNTPQSDVRETLAFIGVIGHEKAEVPAGWVERV